MKEYFSGKELYGDDFSYEQIVKWYEEEAEGYADLGSKDKTTYAYGYHAMNRIHGFNKVKAEMFENVLGFGSAWGYEFEPIIQKINNLTIIEPSDNLVNNKVGNIRPKYVKPSIKGDLPFENNCFDLITCFGALHHVPNVSFVVKELLRVLKPNGYLLLREPIVSMGDWQKPRRGLTKNERGIPVHIFEKAMSKSSVDVVSKQYCFTATYAMQLIFGRFFKRPLYAYQWYVILDKIMARMLRKNMRYHATRKINKIAPASVFYVIRKYEK